MSGMTLNDTIKLVDIVAEIDADGYETFEES